MKFSEEEVNEIISDINNCLDAPEKIYINIFWQCLKEGIYEEDEESPVDLKDYEIDKEAVPASFVGTCMKQAYEDTLSLIETKRLSPDDDELPVPDYSFTPEDVQLVMGWEQFSPIKGGQWFIITKTNFHNLREKIEDNPNPTAGRHRRARTPEDFAAREDDYSYMRKINILGNTDEGFDKLTPIEAFVYYFCKDYIVQDEDYNHIDVVKPVLNVKGEDEIRRELKSQGLNLQDFKDITYQPVPNNVASTSIRMRMFSASKIRRANKIHRFTSIIDETDLPTVIVQ